MKQGGSDAYFILTDQSQINPAFGSYGDHTTGASNMMHVNGGTIANRIVWSEVLPVVPNTDYDVSYWARLAYPVNPPSLRFTVNGAQVGGTLAELSTDHWSNFTATWNSGGATSATLRLFDDVLAYDGNDFALDDFSFTGPSTVPEPSSLALVGVGAIGVASSALRRRLRSGGKATTS